MKYDDNIINIRTSSLSRVARPSPILISCLMFYFYFVSPEPFETISFIAVYYFILSFQVRRVFFDVLYIDDARPPCWFSLLIWLLQPQACKYIVKFWIYCSIRFLSVSTWKSKVLQHQIKAWVRKKKVNHMRTKCGPEDYMRRTFIGHWTLASDVYAIFM